MARPRFQNLDREIRHRILETAAAEFAANGFDGTSLNRLLGRVGLSKGSFYYYFDDKADLFDTVAAHARRIVQPAIDFDPGALDAATFWPTLELMLWEGRARVRENPWLAGFLRRLDQMPRSGAAAERGDSRIQAPQNWLAELVRQGQKVGAVRSDLPAPLLQVLLAGADEVGDQWVIDNWHRFETTEIERISEAVVAILRGILEPPPRGAATKGGDPGR